MTRRLLSLSCCVAGLAAGCHKPFAPPPSAERAEAAWVEDITAQSGVRFVHNPGTTGRFFFPESVGSGAALFDYDDDGRLDLYLLQNGEAGSGSSNQLYHQELDGTFRNVSAGSGLDIADYCMGVAAGDYDNDGRPDILVTEYRRIRLFHNDGGGRFRNVSESAAVENRAWGISAAFVDYDRDGWLDMVVANYIENVETQQCFDRSGELDYCGPSGFLDRPTALFHNLGRDAAGGVRFDDVTVKAGLAAEPGPGLGVTAADFDGDGWPDLFVTNDGKPNAVWINQRDGTFRNEAMIRGIAYNAMGQPQANMGIAIGDTTGRGMLDVFVTHLIEETNILWREGPRGAFLDRTAAAGLTGARWHGTGFGTAFVDMDNDGALDLPIVNGSVRHPRVDDGRPKLLPELGPHWSRYAERNQLFANDGTGKFRDISFANPSFSAAYQVGRGLACGDLDNDGGIDFLVTAIAAPARIFRNVAPRRGHWLCVRAVEPALGGRDAYGARITVAADGRERVGWINPAYSYASSNDPRAHFGLGSTASFAEIRVLWPEGEEERFPGGPADRAVALRKGDGHPATATAGSAAER